MKYGKILSMLKRFFSSYTFWYILVQVTDWWFEPRREEPKTHIVKARGASSLRQRFWSCNTDQNYLRSLQRTDCWVHWKVSDSMVRSRVCISNKFHTLRTTILENSRCKRCHHSKRACWRGKTGSKAGQTKQTKDVEVKNNVMMTLLGINTS